MPRISQASNLTLIEPSKIRAGRRAQSNAAGALKRRPQQNVVSTSGTLADLHPNEAPGTETLIQRLTRKEGLLNSKEVIGMLGVHITTLQLWTRRGEIPFLRVGHLVRFDPVQLAHWLGKRQDGA